MRTSFHFASVPIPQTDRYLLFQTLRGAVDVVPADLALALGQREDPSASLSEDEADILARRGYLTNQTPEQERQQSDAALEITARKRRAALEILFRISSDSGWKAESAGRNGSIADVFALGAELAGEDASVMVSLEVSPSQVDGEVMNKIFEAAKSRDYPVLPQVTITGLDALLPWLKSENFRQLTLTSDRSNAGLNVEDVSRKVIHCFENQIYVTWKCAMDDVGAEQIEAVQAICERVRQKYPAFMIVPISEKHDGTSNPLMLGAEGKLPAISSENAVVLSTVLRFITMPTAINYRPFFSVDPDQFIVEVETGNLTYKSPSGELLIKGDEAIRRSTANIVEKRRENPWKASATDSVCLACKYSLVCGRDWIGSCGHSTISECSTSFERRIEQVLPLVLLSLRGNWQRPEAKKATT